MYLALTSRLEAYPRVVSIALLIVVSSFGIEKAAGQVRQQSNQSGTDVIVVAHADDWQVFMGDVIVEGIKSGRRPVFIYLTAGDHGREAAYWRQRETAAMQSTRIALGITDTLVHCDSIMARQHSIAHCRLGVSDSYFLRLPDGNRNGAGFARNQFESLRKLRANRVSLVSAVDSSTRYSDWQDLNATVSTLVHMVADSTRSSVTLHTTDPSIRINPHDHYDHRMAGKLIESLVRANGWHGRYYVGYALAMRAPNRTTLQRQEKTEVFSAYDREMKLINPAWSAYREHPGFYAECMERTYSRSVTGISAGSRTMRR